ncbi:MAG TPA: hypothetical protein DCE41_13125 [Cytophagales bacterium]|nr:hypothetical protein [Cytophagales bacterium]HAA20222.1 hypothetical protein [Cytophagales bacterium]HAP64983.1 hypothetical protein [Cytophagales bacterium]
MGYVKEPEGVDFIINSQALTDEARKEISAFIQKQKDAKEKTLSSSRIDMETLLGLFKEVLQQDTFINNLLANNYLSFRVSPNETRLSLRINHAKYLDQSISNSTKTLRDWIDHHQLIPEANNYELPLVWVDHGIHRGTLKFVARRSFISSNQFELQEHPGDHDTQYSKRLSWGILESLSVGELTYTLQAWAQYFKGYFLEAKDLLYLYARFPAAQHRPGAVADSCDDGGYLLG